MNSLSYEHFLAEVFSQFLYLLNKVFDVDKLGTGLGGNISRQGFGGLKSQSRVLPGVGEERGG